MKDRTFFAIILATLLFSPISLTVFAQDPSEQSRPCRIGHFTAFIPLGWNSFSDSDKAGAKREFATDLAPGLRQYEKAGATTPHMGEFEIFQKPTDAQLIGWTLVIPDQTDFLKEILRREDVQFEKGKNLSGGRITGGSCRLVKIGGFDVVRVDVEMANGGKSTNLHFWSPKTPGVMSTLMIGLRPHKSDQTEKDYESIISTLIVSEDIDRIHP
ncbi:MAG: hypothetical protein KKF30_19000 [Proteobacteria bacterium]|nr:hypothetical protein [Pseudomonadota bacterium]